MSVKDFWFYLKARLNALETLKKKKASCSPQPIASQKAVKLGMGKKTKRLDKCKKQG